MNTDRFKFRAWDKKRKKMFYSSEKNNTPFIANGVLTLTWIYFDTSDDYVWNDLVIIQCTGLKDSEGQLIYEGDIVESGNMSWEVEWQEYMFNLKGFYASSYDYPCIAFSEGLTVKIIGNIYQNPEILEKQDIE